MTYTPSRGLPSSPYNISKATTLLLQNLLNNTEYSIFVCAFTAVGCSLNITARATTLPGKMRLVHMVFTNEEKGYKSIVSMYYFKCQILKKKRLIL